MKTISWLAGLLPLMVACSAHSPVIIKNTTDVKPVAAAQFPAHSNPILMVQGPLPDTVKYQGIAQIDVGKIWYGGSKDSLTSMAVRARQLGADAVIDVRTWHQPSGFSWAAPHGRGKAVKIFNKEEIGDLSALGPMY